MNHFLYFAILCLTYIILDKVSTYHIPSDYWFLSGWIAGVAIAMLYKAFVDYMESE